MSEHTEAIPRYPLAWPAGWVRTLPGKRQRATFRQVRREAINGSIQKRDVAVSVFVATQRLEAELDRLGAKNPTLSTNVELRLDGRPRSDIEPYDRGVACYFVYKGRATVFACDKWDRVADNIAAIAAHIDALRRIARYGVGSIEQALAGYKALPADTAADWRSVFGFQKDSVPTLDQLDKAYKQAARAHHPDRGGTDAGMSHVNRAHDFALEEFRG